MSVLRRECTHLDQINDVKPGAEGCEECLQMGDTWVHLRECLTCGHVGCCDSSKNKHATGTSTPRVTRSSSPSNRTKTGSGASSTRSSWNPAS